jgi:hypothetical protein
MGLSIIIDVRGMSAFRSRRVLNHPQLEFFLGIDAGARIVVMRLLRGRTDAF